MKLTPHWQALFITGLGLIGSASAANVYKQSFDSFANGTADLGDGTAMGSNSPAGTTSVQNGALRLTRDTVASTTATFKVPKAVSGDSFSVVFDFALSGGGSRPADGFSLNIGAIDPSGEVFGPGEEGFGQGLAVEFDTWDNDDAGANDTVGYDISVDGETVDNGVFAISNTTWNNNEAYKFDGLFRTVEIYWEKAGAADGTLTMIVDDRVFFNKLPVKGWQPAADHIVAFSARTGGAFETLLIDNLSVDAPMVKVLRDPKIGGDSAVDFGAVESGKSATKKLTVKNDGSSKDLTIAADSALSGAGAANFKVATAFPITIKPGQSATVDVSFTAPTQLGSYSALLTLNNNDSAEGKRKRGITLSAASIPSSSGTARYANDFEGYSDGVTDLKDGSSLSSSTPEAIGIERSALRLSKDGVGSTLTGFVLPPLGEQATKSWQADFLFALSGGGARPADGFSFNYGPIDDEARAGEEGFAGSLTVAFDTWNNEGEGQDTGIGIDIRANGGEVDNGTQRETADADPIDNKFYKFDGKFRPAKILWKSLGGGKSEITVTVDGVVIYNKLPVTDFTPEADFRFAFGARTGGAFETLLIDDLRVSAPAVEAVKYVQDFSAQADGTTDLKDGTKLFTNNGVGSVQKGALQLTKDGTTGSQTLFTIPSPGAVTPEGWSARFDLTLIAGGTPADGFSFNYGKIPTALTGGEEGVGAGLAVEFDTWNNEGEGAANGIGLDLSVDGKDLPNGTSREAAGADPKNNKFYKFDGVSRPVEIIWKKTGADTGTISVKYDGVAHYTNLPVTGFIAFPDYGFSFAARTGGATETVLVDNLEINAPASEVSVRDPKIGGDSDLALAAEQGKSVNAKFRIANEGKSRPLTISSGELSGTDKAAFEILTKFPLVIAAGATAEVEVKYNAPSQLVTSSASLVLSNDDSLARAQKRDIGLTGVVYVAGGKYSQNFDAFADDVTDLKDGSVMGSNNDVTKIAGKRLQLTLDGTGGSVGAYKLPPLGPNVAQGFTASFDVALDAAGQPADGFSFNYGAISGDATNFGPGEEGFGSGLAVEFDTWDNGGEGATTGIGIDVSVKGKDLPGGVQRLEAGDDPKDNKFFRFDGKSRKVEITWAKKGADNGEVTVIVDGVKIYDKLATPGFAPGAGDRFAFSARTGGAFESVFIDNMLVNPATGTPQLGDSDTDGVSDALEAIAGTDPKSAADFLRLVSAHKTAAGVGLSIASKAGKKYRVEYSTDLKTWLSAGEVTATGNATPFTDNNAGRIGAKAGFYRAVVVP